MALRVLPRADVVDEVSEMWEENKKKPQTAVIQWKSSSPARHELGASPAVRVSRALEIRSRKPAAPDSSAHCSCNQPHLRVQSSDSPVKPRALCPLQAAVPQFTTHPVIRRLVQSAAPPGVPLQQQNKAPPTRPSRFCNLHLPSSPTETSNACMGGATTNVLRTTPLKSFSISGKLLVISTPLQLPHPMHVVVHRCWHGVEQRSCCSVGPVFV